MGKKYIIEIPEDKIADFVGSTHFLMPYMMAGHIGHHDTGLPIEPYTEPDLDAIRNEAYEKGVQDTKQHWVDAPRTCAYKFGYENGLNDAWWAARKILFNPDDGGMSAVDVNEVFGENSWTVMKDFSASEVVAKIREYEDSKQKEKKEEKSISVEDVMRQYLNMFCHNAEGCAECPLNTFDFTCGRGRHFLTDNPVSDEEVRRAYAKVMKEK